MADVRVAGAVFTAVLAIAACTGSAEIGQPSPAPSATEAPSAAVDPAAPQVDVEPQPFVPAGPVGNAAAYDDLIRELAAHVPAELRNQVPWPDLRNPDPVVAQLAIFELWIWMEANHPDPDLVAAMAAAGSPSRIEIAGLFGEIERSATRRERAADPYVAFDHRSITFESAGLPLWLARDVPADAVVVYYQDRSGPVTVRDRESGAIVDRQPAVAARQWLSIMVPTEVGWLLFRDQLIEPGNPELEVPDQVVPGPGGIRLPEL